LTRGIKGKTWVEDKKNGLHPGHEGQNSGAAREKCPSSEA